MVEDFIELDRDPQRKALFVKHLPKQLQEAMEKGELDEDDKDVPEDELKQRYRDIAVRRVRDHPQLLLKPLF